MACGPKCLRCMYEMPSGPVADEFFVRLIAAMVCAGVNIGGSCLSVCILCNRLLMRLLLGCCGS